MTPQFQTRRFFVQFQNDENPIQINEEPYQIEHRGSDLIGFFKRQAGDEVFRISKNTS